MTLEVRRLDLTTDHELFEQSYRWLVESPTWRRDTELVFGTLDRAEYIGSAAGADNRVDVGVFVDSEFVAKIALHLAAKGVYEASLEAARLAPLNAIVTAGCTIRDQLFGEYGAQLVFAWVPRWAGGVKRVLTAIGFRSDHVTMLRGTCRGRLIEWQRFSLGVGQ